MDPIKTIGQVIDKDAQRDAIHIAIMPCIVDEDWVGSGELVKIKYGTKDCVVRAYRTDLAHGVIDPFFEGIIRKGDRVWVFLKPNTIQSLRHEWTHPGIDQAPAKDGTPERWLREFADKWNFNYDEMIEAASDTSKSKWGHYITAQGKDLHSAGELGEDHDLFWMYLEEFKKTTFSEEHKKTFGWSCSC